MTEVCRRPLKIPRHHEACEGSKSSNRRRVLKRPDNDDDEYLRQFLLFYYQFQKSEGFTVDWDQFDYVFETRSLDNSPQRISDTKSHAQLIREATLFAIEKHNEATGTKLVFVEHVQANYRFASGLLYWLTFWAMDLASSTPESRVYQVKLWRRGERYEIPVFRLKPTEEEIASIEVEPPCPKYYDDFDNPAIVFARAGPEDGGAPFVFKRTGTGLDPNKMFL